MGQIEKLLSTIKKTINDSENIAIELKDEIKRLAEKIATAKAFEQLEQETLLIELLALSALLPVSDVSGKTALEKLKTFVSDSPNSKNLDLINKLNDQDLLSKKLHTIKNFLNVSDNFSNEFKQEVADLLEKVTNFEVFKLNEQINFLSSFFAFLALPKNEESKNSSLIERFKYSLPLLSTDSTLFDETTILIEKLENQKLIETQVKMEKLRQEQEHSPQKAVIADSIVKPVVVGRRKKVRHVTISDSLTSSPVQSTKISEELVTGSKDDYQEYTKKVMATPPESPVEVQSLQADLNHVSTESKMQEIKTVGEVVGLYSTDDKPSAVSFSSENDQGLYNNENFSVDITNNTNIEKIEASTEIEERALIEKHNKLGELEEKILEEKKGYKYLTESQKKYLKNYIAGTEQSFSEYQSLVDQVLVIGKLQHKCEQAKIYLATEIDKHLPENNRISKLSDEGKYQKIKEKAEDNSMNENVKSSAAKFVVFEKAGREIKLDNNDLVTSPLQKIKNFNEVITGKENKIILHKHRTPVIVRILSAISYMLFSLIGASIPLWVHLGKKGAPLPGIMTNSARAFAECRSEISKVTSKASQEEEAVEVHKQSLPSAKP